MRKGIKSKAVAFTLVALMVGPLAARAEGEMTSSLQGLEARLMALEDKLAASEATIAAQQHLIRAQQPVAAEGGLDDFLKSLEIGGHISASYVYNFNNPDQNTGNVSSGPDHGTQPTFQFNTDHNTFAFDAAKIEIGKSADEPGTAGFQFDLLFGENAGVNRTFSSAFGTTSPRADGQRDLADNAVFVDQAYVSYNADGVKLDMGKFYTWMGSEVMDSVENANVTHSMIFTFGIPLWHTGIRAGGELGEGVGWGVGVVNGFNNVTDYGDNKGIIGLLGWSDEMVELTGTIFVGSEGVRATATPASGLPCTTLTAGTDPTLGPFDCVGDNSHRTWIFDVVARVQPNDELKLWAEGNYGISDGDIGITAGPFTPTKAATDAKWYALQLGGQFEINEKTYIALRGEYFRDDNGVRFGNSPTNDTDAYEATVTLGYRLTDNLLARLEYRRDWWDADPDTSPFGQQARGAVAGVGTLANADTRTQDVGLIEVSYIFD